MITSNRRGITCDYCRMTSMDQFSYMAVEYNTVEVCTSRYFTRPAKLAFEADMCKACFDKLIEHTKKAIRKSTNTSIPCDVCPTIMQGDFTYCFVRFSEVTVNKSSPTDQMKVDKYIMDSRICLVCEQKARALIANNHTMIKAQGNWS